MASGINDGYRLCTYNMGESLGDFLTLCSYVNPQFTYTPEKDQNNLNEKYANTQKRVAELLCNAAEVCFFQEASILNRPIIQVLRNRNYQIYTTKTERIDTLIALHSDFEIGENHSRLIDRDDYLAIVTTTHKPTGQTFTFVSAHVTGCNIDNKVDADDASYGDTFCAKIAEILDKIGVGTIQIIGLDMNANPEKWQPRFDYFTKRGFEIHRTHTPTCVKPLSLNPNYKEREIDFFLVRKPSKSRLASLLSMVKTPPANKITITKNQLLGFNVETNASDHVPIFALFSLNS